MIKSILVGAVVSAFVAGGAYKKGSLSKSGFVAALVAGTLIFSMGHMSSYALMMMFFITGSLLSKVNRKVSIRRGLKTEELLNETGRRNHVQVFANAGVAMILCIAYFFSGSDFFMVASAVSFAAANSDTWASEIGTLSRKKPVYIFKRTNVEAGLSGGVSGLGFVASFFGSLVIALSFFLILGFERGFTRETIIYFLVVLAFGFAGSVVDSALGELCQVKYRSNDGRITEKPVEKGVRNEVASGLSFMDNNMVNFVSVLIVSLLSAVILIFKLS